MIKIKKQMYLEFFLYQYVRYTFKPFNNYTCSTLRMYFFSQ